MSSLKGTARIDCLNELGSEYSNPYWSKSKYVRTDSALFYTLQAQKEAQQLNYTCGIGKALQNLAMVEEEYGNYIKSEYYTRLAIPIFEKKNMQTELNRAQINLGNCFFHQGKYNRAIQILQKELPYYQSVKDTEHVAMIFIMIGLNLNSQGYSEKAFEYFERNFNIQEKPTDLVSILYSPERRADLYLGAGDTTNALLYYRKIAEHADEHHIILDYSNVIMSTIYTLQKQYDSAIFCLNQNMLSIKTSNNDSLFKNRELMLDAVDILPIHLLLNDFDSVIKYGQDALRRFTTGGDIDNMMPVLKNVTKAYIMKSEYKKALHYAKKLLGYAEKTGARPFIRDGYLFLSEIFAAQHKIDLAYKYQLQYIALNDLLKKDNYSARLAAYDVITKMNTGEENYRNQLKSTEERNNAKIELINKEKQLQLYAFISAIIIALLLTIGLARNTRLKRKKNQLQLAITEANNKIEKQKKEQEITTLQQQKIELELQGLRAQMNPHFIFNCLNSINRFIINNDAAKAADYLTKFAKLIRIVLEQSGKSFITLEDEICWLKLYLDLEALRFETPFQYEINCNRTDTSPIMIPTLLIQPFVENAIWHGLHPKQNGIGKINISMHQQEDVLHCSICDNGVGIDNANEKIQVNKKSLGMQLTQQRLQTINGNQNESFKIKLEQLKDEAGLTAGTCVFINIPFKND